MKTPANGSAPLYHPPAAGVPELPRVSVVMPVRNEARHIEQSLRPLLEQEYPAGRLEVLVVDGRSEDATRERVLAAAAERPEIELRLLDNPQRTAAAALNRGLAEARGEVVVRVDGHCEIGRDYLLRAVEALAAESGAGCVGGPVEHVGTTPAGRAIAAAMSSRFGVGGSPFRTVTDRRMRVDTVPFPAFRRQAIEAAGPFDETLERNQDDEYSYRLRRLGWHILIVPAMRTRYTNRSGLRALWRQYYGYGFWKVPVLRKHPQRLRARHLVPPFFVLALLGSLASAPWTLLPAVLVVGAYAAANLGASLWTASRRGWRNLPALPLCFACLHVAYGVGFVVGLLRFAAKPAGV